MTNFDLKNTKCAVMWGTGITSMANYARTFKDVQKNIKLIVIDPRRTAEAARADIWLQVRPGTDCALALAMMNVIINEELYDKEFVERWTHGFDELKKHVQDYPVDKVSQITWVPADKIAEAARLYAKSGPASIASGAGAMVQNVNSFQTNRAITMLAAITGNLDVPGGQVYTLSPLRRRSSQAANVDGTFGKLSKEQVEKRLGADQWRIVKDAGLILSPPHSVIPAITEGKPYWAKMLFNFGQNFVVGAANSKRVRAALMKFEFMVHVDLFMNPTADIADIILPAKHFTEKDMICDYFGTPIYCQPQLIEAPGECWDDRDILIELARRLNLADYWSSVPEYLDYVLEPIGLTYEQFREKTIIDGSTEYRKHEKFGKFRTASGKVDLYSDALKDLGYLPMPTHVEPPESPVSTPDLAKEYPLILSTGYKTSTYLLSCFRNIPSLRKREPDPVIQIHPDTAAGLGIKSGDWVRIESLRGGVKAKAELFEGIHPKVVATPYGWWHGYEDGWKEVNINVLTDDEHCDPQMGSTSMRALLCKVTKLQ